MSRLSEANPNVEASAVAGLTYAIWDSENSTKMDGRRINEFIERARPIIYWLGVHGYKIVPLDSGPSPEGMRVIVTEACTEAAKAAIEECAKIARAISDRYAMQAGELYGKHGEGRANAKSDAADEIEQEIRAALHEGEKK